MKVLEELLIKKFIVYHTHPIVQLPSFLLIAAPQKHKFISRQDVQIYVYEMYKQPSWNLQNPVLSLGNPNNLISKVTTSKLAKI